MAALEFIQQFALLNQITLNGYGGPDPTPYVEYSYPLRASYGASEPLPANVATPFVSSADCQGLDFNDTQGDNDSLTSGIISANSPGFYVFSAPWETISALMTNINTIHGYKLSLPATFAGSNYVYVISIAASTGAANFSAYNANLSPPSTAPSLPAGVQPAACNIQQTYFKFSNTGTIPANINKNSTIYMIRHAEAHPVAAWDDGNYVGAGQWRALALPAILSGLISPQMIYSIDPAQVLPGSMIISGNPNFCYVRPSLTIEPYAIAHSLPYFLVTNIEMFDMDASAIQAMDSFFFGGTFSNKIILVVWEHNHFQPMITTLFQSYGGATPPVPSWPEGDYDTIWRVQFDSQGNVTVDNALCEGIDSASLPAAPPQF